MHFLLIVSCVLMGLCSAHLNHEHDRLSKEHFMDAEHNLEYDKEAFFGGEIDADELAKLSPEEQQERLKSLIKKMDINSDGLLSEDELSLWIQQSFHYYATIETKQDFPKVDTDGNGAITWEEYNMYAYNTVIHYDEDTVTNDNEEESFKTLHLREKKRFKAADLDGVPGLNISEFVAFQHPEEVSYMLNYVVKETLDEVDKDQDGFISLSEFLGDYKKDPTSADPEWLIVEKDHFEKDYDTNADGKLDPQELIPWVMPNNMDVAQKEASHLITSMDLNGDGKLSEAEILENQELFLSSEATDYGRQLHNKHFYHDEL
ncbi:reticulocalbin-2 [Latimeria chalumnae]|uniref:Reticulocalbin-3 n=1 Tax=Latimeria chalumnae TaxID=7897 RepID=H3B0S6_LATCH|nr:PREDICTED: reticulocalbin-2 isoform X2 [Latimeria chalumnae]|eukprot:XP_014343695.1 PREDICTED: reticulocalbin-2 isoform X2 [Latimeria chalumnae]